MYFYIIQILLQYVNTNYNVFIFIYNISIYNAKKEIYIFNSQFCRPI